MRAALYAVFSLALVLGIIAAAGYWRVMHGPVALGFLNGRIETAINAEIPNFKIKLGDAVLEIDPKTHVPEVRFKNLALSDLQGNILATAPRAAVTLDLHALLTGKIEARNLKLIGPRINARRNLDGTVTLGVGGEANPADKPIIVDEGFGASEKSDQQDVAITPLPNQTSGAKLIELLDGSSSASQLSSLQDITVSDALLTFFDDANAATWIAPQADLTFHKTAMGFAVETKANVISKGPPWQIELAANYDRQSGNFDVQGKIANLIPADVAEKIYALAQFAKVNLPLSGHVQLVVNRSGAVQSGNAEFLAGSGNINLPDFLAKPLTIDSGIVAVSYKPDTGAFDLADSSLILGGAKINVSGVVQPNRAQDGKLASVGITLKADRPDRLINKMTDGDSPVDRIEFAGKAGVEQAEVTIDDLVVMSGNTGIRLRGTVASGEQSPSVHVAGRVRDISAEFLKAIWPPIVAAKTRSWISENVAAGTIKDGSFQINFAENALASARAGNHFPENSIDLEFTLADVTSHFFKSLPDLENAAGTAQQHDNDFTLNIAQGQARLPTGETITLNSGSFKAQGLLLPEVPGEFAFDLQAPVQSMVAFAAHPDLKIIKSDSLATLPKIKGTARAQISLKFPLIKDVPKDRVEQNFAIKVSDTSIQEALPGADLTNGEFDVTFDDQAVRISGPAKLNGLGAKLSWVKPRNGAAATTEVFATLDEATRVKLGMKIADYLSGPLPVHAIITKDDSGITKAQIDADLSLAALKLNALGWKRAAIAGTTASFTLTTADKTRSIDDFKLDGEGLHLKGSAKTNAKGEVSSLVMDEIRLDDDNIFRATLTPGDGSFDLGLSGNRFDARPYIKNIVAPAPAGGGATTGGGGPDFTLRANFNKVTANRGEVITDVKSVIRVRAGKIAEADIRGQFLNGQPVIVSVVPSGVGREMRVQTNDAGSALRAANFYSKVAGGVLNFYALVSNDPGSPIRKGFVNIANFEVRNEAALAELDKRGKPQKSGPRKDGLTFTKFFLPFETDEQFVRLGETILRGSDMCATADGVVRKQDGAIDITGSVIPACALTGVFNNVPLLGDILSGGNNNEGLFGVTYAVSGTLNTPKIKVNPLSALAPGIFRRFFDYRGKRGPVQAADDPPKSPY